MLLTKWFTESLRSITERLNGITEKQTDAFFTQEAHAAHISGMKRDIGQLIERQDIAAAERRGIERANVQAFADIRAAISGIQTRLQNLGSMSVEQDHGIESIDARCNDFVKAIDALRERTTQLEIASGENLETRDAMQTRSVRVDQSIEACNKASASIRAEMESRTEQLSDRIRELETATRKDRESIDTIATSQSIHFGHSARLLDRVVKLERFNETQSKCQEINAESLAKLDQRVSDVIASLQYTGAPAEFVRYTHAADLAEVVRKIVRAEMNDFDFGLRIDSAVNDAARRATIHFQLNPRAFDERGSAYHKPGSIVEVNRHGERIVSAHPTPPGFTK